LRSVISLANIQPRSGQKAVIGDRGIQPRSGDRM
jgi:hypothetical protein